MRIYSIKTLSGLVTIAAICLVQSVAAISPVVIMFYGEPLTVPVFVTAVRFFHNYENPTTITVADMKERPYLKVAMFWGPEYEKYAVDPSLLPELRAEKAGQHARLYLSSGSDPIVLLQMPVGSPNVVQPAPIQTDPTAYTWGGKLRPDDVDFLRKVGVPIDYYRKR